MLKHVWILNHYAQSPDEMGGTRHYSFARYLPRSGWSASIIAASTELNTNRQRLATSERSRMERIGEACFLWLRTPQYSGNGGGRILNMLTYSWRAVMPGMTACLPRPDVVIGSSVHPFAAISGAILARRHRVPFIFEVRDLWPETLIDMGRLRRNGLTAICLRALEKWLYRRANRIIVLLPHAKDYIVPLGIEADRIVWIPNGIDIDAFPTPPRASSSGVFTLMYFGAHGEANGLDNLLRAMAIVPSLGAPAAVRLRLVGAGPSKAALVCMAAQLGLRSVLFEDPVEKSAIPALAAQADAFVFSLIDVPVFRFGISSNKLFDFLAGGRPVIFCCRASNNPVAEAGAGFTVEPGSPEQLAHSIARIVSLPLEQRWNMGLAGRRFVAENHGFDRLTMRLAGVLSDVCRDHGDMR